MEDAGLYLKEVDSFEILPHLSEDDKFIETQKYRHLKQYTDDLISETNSLSSSNVWSVISETELFDIRNPFDTSDSESDIIVLKPTSDLTILEKFSSEIETDECDYFVQETVSHGESLRDQALQTASVNNLDLVPYNNKFEHSETNYLSSINALSISETEFNDLRNLLNTSYSESNFIDLESSSDFTAQEKFSSKIETVESNSSVQEIVPNGESLVDNALKTIPVNNLVLVPYNNQTENGKKQLETEDLKFEYPLNNSEGIIIDIILDQVLKTILDGAFHDAGKNTLPCGETRSKVAIENAIEDSLNENIPPLIACEETENKRMAVKVHRGRSKSSKKICGVFHNGIKFCEWLLGNRLVRTVLESAQFSFNSFVNLFGMEFNRIRDIEEECLNLTIVSEDSHCRAIEEAFLSIFHGRVSFSRVISPIQDSIPGGPVLPIGHLAGVHSAEMKIHSAKQSSRDSTVIATSTLLYEDVPQRWQMTTVICLDDPKLQLQLHNFTVSTPIPFVTDAKNKTLRDTSFAVSLEGAVSARTPEIVKDIQDILTGFHSYTSLKSAALVLAGIFIAKSCPAIMATAF
ncbi:hypothetical protein JTE90_017762 [Oedothorax gibbosus]|uniref:Uncharacterized protein n=1 Tax=Oedothorax gibbosus TaxID=931172 RepID=A0AAV6ULA6_9ARAC|nr:hypothetical protein JTE90_017762 [Oedothorax gibbosus]